MAEELKQIAGVVIELAERLSEIPELSSDDNAGEEKLLDHAKRCSPLFSRVKMFFSTSKTLEFSAFSHTDHILVLFPGSKMNWHDWRGAMGNTRATMKHRHGGWVHSGFWRQVDEFWCKLKRFIDEEPHKKVVLAGHSRGGALAVLAALRLEEDDRNCDRIKAVLTAGQPKAVGRRLAKAIMSRFGDRFYRVETSADIVPGLPGIFYSHTGNHILIPENGDYFINLSPQQVEDIRRQDASTGFLSRICQKVSRHKVKNYCGKIRYHVLGK